MVQVAVMYPLMKPACCIAQPFAVLSHGITQNHEKRPFSLTTSSYVWMPGLITMFTPICGEVMLCSPSSVLSIVSCTFWPTFTANSIACNYVVSANVGAAQVFFQLANETAVPTDLIFCYGFQ